MKVDEIRTYLKGWSAEDILKLYTATYRKLPKEKKEEVDELIRNGMGAPNAKPTPKKPTQDDLEETIENLKRFIDNAREGNYYYANRKVSKKERSNWRFTCGRFIKFFMAYEESSPEFDLVNVHLCLIYDILCHACTFYTFASQDPFHTLGYENQVDFFIEIAQRVIAGCQDEESLSTLIEVACKGENDRDTYYPEILKALIQVMGDRVDYDEVLRITQNLFVPVREEYEDEYKGQFHFMITERQVELDKQYEALGWFIVLLHVHMGEIEKAYEAALGVDLENDKEVDLYCLLSYYIKDPSEWIQIYEMALKEGVKPRDYLKEEYEKKKKGE